MDRGELTDELLGIFTCHVLFTLFAINVFWFPLLYFFAVVNRCGFYWKFSLISEIVGQLFLFSIFSFHIGKVK